MPATAAAGGWATVGLSSTPDGRSAGEAWVVDIEVLQHGRTPLEGVQPSVIVSERGTGAERTIPAQATSKPGIYRARVVFPRRGEYEYVVDDGFTQRHSYPPVRIGALAATVPSRDAGAGFPWTTFLVSLIAGLLAAAAVVLLQRRGTASTAEGRS